MKYLIARTSWLADMEGLSDSERGRLFTALLRYAESGEKEEPRGSEKVLFYKMCNECANDVQMSNIYINSNNTLSQVSNSPSTNLNTILSFDEFWDAYPTKVNKKRCADIWSRLKPSQELIQKMLCSIEAWKHTRQWKEGYIPYPDTWLRGEKWNDEIPAEPKPRNAALDYKQSPINVDDFDAMLVNLDEIRF